jgi:anti-sigma B factor antagonist
MLDRFNDDDQELRMEIRREGAATVLAPRGEVTAFSSPILRQSLREATASKPMVVVMDLSGTAYVDSSGVATMVEALQIVSRYGGKLVLAGMSDRVRGVFEIARLQTVFEIAGSVEEALGT